MEERNKELLKSACKMVGCTGCEDAYWSCPKLQGVNMSKIIRFAIMDDLLNNPAFDKYISAMVEMMLRDIDELNK